MKEELYLKLITLKEFLLASPNYLLVKENENKMLADNEAHSLMVTYQALMEEQQELVRYNLDTAQVMKRLSEHKIKVMENAFIKSYLQSLNQFNDLLFKVKNTMLKGIIDDNKSWHLS